MRNSSVQQAAFEKRATEASDLIARLVAAGATPAQIAEQTSVSERTVYRWWKSGNAPHPILLEGLRRMVSERGL
jgi:DNA-binding NarL/FixJ family response regulator